MMKFALFAIVTFTFVLSFQSNVLSQSQDDSSQLAEKVYSTKDVDEPLKIKAKPKAQYTESARKNCINGRVLLKAVFKATGKVENIEVVKGLSEGLSESAIEAAKKIKFEPAKKGGQKVSVSAKIDYNFDYSLILPCTDGKRNR